MSCDEKSISPKLQVVSGAVGVHEAGELERVEEHGEAEGLGVEVELEVAGELGRVHRGVEHEHCGLVQVQRLLAPVPAGVLHPEYMGSYSAIIIPLITFLFQL